jgi:cobalt/nickel transport system permease protein
VSGAHHDLEQHRGTGGFLDARDPRAKIVSTLVLILAVVLVPRGDWGRLLLAAPAIVATAGLGSARPSRVLGRAALVLPFAVLSSVFLPLALAADLVVRAVLSGIALASLSLATEPVDLIRGFSSLGMPRALVLTMAFTIRYLGLLRAEMARLQLARQLKTFEWRPGLALRAMGHSAGTLFLRTFERAERVHAAMVARGFAGTFPSLAQPRLGTADLALVGGAIVCSTLVLVVR